MARTESNWERIAKGVLLMICSLALIGVFVWWLQSGLDRHPDIKRHPGWLALIGVAGIVYGLRIVLGKST